MSKDAETLLRELRAECGMTPDGRYSHPTPHLARRTYTELQPLLQDLPVEGLGTQNVIDRVKWLLEQFKVLNPHTVRCYHDGKVWWCDPDCQERARR